MGWILALIRQLVLWAVTQGIFLWLAARGIYPQQWVATLLGLTLAASAWDGPTLIVSGIIAFILTVLWEKQTAVAGFWRVVQQWGSTWKVQSPLVRGAPALPSATAPASAPAPRGGLLRKYRDQKEITALHVALRDASEIVTAEVQPLHQRLFHLTKELTLTMGTEDGRKGVIELGDICQRRIPEILKKIETQFVRGHDDYSDEAWHALEGANDALNHVTWTARDCVVSALMGVREPPATEGLRRLLAGSLSAFRDQEVGRLGIWCDGAVKRLKAKREAVDAL